MPFMAHPADARRRWLGLFCLTTAGGMVTWGLIVLGSELRGFLFLFYWAACFLFTVAAIFIALVDMRAVRRRIQEEEEDLLTATVAEIERSKQKSPRGPASGEVAGGRQAGADVESGG